MLVKIIRVFLITTIFTTLNASAIEITKCSTTECKNYFKSFKKAAKRGHRNAMYNLGKFYQYGFGTEIDKARALKFYKKAGVKGVRQAGFKAGELMLKDKDLYDFEDGVKWLKIASRKGQPNAAFLLGQTYYSAKKYDDADFWLTIIYQSHPKKVAKWLNKSRKLDDFNPLNLPLLHDEFINTPLNTFDSELSNEMEVISVTGYHRNSALDYMLAGFRKKITSTGTRLPGITCDGNVACNKKTLNEMKDNMWVSQK